LFKLSDGVVDIVGINGSNAVVAVKYIIVRVAQLKQQISAAEVYPFLFNANAMSP